jgi:predicted TIM-barrel enzyme
VDHQIEHDHTEGIGSFFGASSVERLPTELAIKSQAEASNRRV